MCHWEERRCRASTEQPVFHSCLTMEEIEKNFEDFDLFDALISALEECRNSQKTENGARNL